jgi:hypothetical protein
MAFNPVVLQRVNMRIVVVTSVLYFVLFMVMWSPEAFSTSLSAQTGVVAGTPSLKGLDNVSLETNAIFVARKANKARQAAVVDMAKHAWAGYMKHAKGADELMPVSNGRRDNWGGSRPTSYDAIDLFLVMGLEAEANEAIDMALELVFDPRAKVEKDVPTVKRGFAFSVFETNIRHVGAMLSAFSLTGDHRFVAQAEEVASLLLPAFKTPTGIAKHQVSYNWGDAYATNEDWCNGQSILAEAGTMQLELRFLSLITGNRDYADHAQRFTQHVLKTMDRGWPTNRELYLNADAPTMPHKGLFPTFVDPNSGKWSGAASLASLSDSFYEYQLKQWILFGDAELLELYENAVEAILSTLLKYTTEKHFAYVGHTGIGFEPTLDHLTCFVPGMLILGVMQGAHDSKDHPRDHRSWGPDEVSRAAVDLAATCYRLYLESPTGIAPEVVHFNTTGGYTVSDPKYLLRPETLESLFYLYRYTRDSKYRDWGWAIVDAIERHCRTPAGYSALKSVMEVPPTMTDKMESFFFAETLKYAYLLFSDDSDSLSLDEFVFNTEGHPFKIQLAIDKMNELARDGRPHHGGGGGGNESAARGNGSAAEERESADSSKKDDADPNEYPPPDEEEDLPAS